MSKIRRKLPIPIEKDGKKTIGCPYCRPSHELTLDGKEAICGTRIEIMAVQDMKHEKDIVCAVCGGTGGTFVKHGNVYRHPGKCSPTKMALPSMPKLSAIGGWLYSLPVAWQKRIARIANVRAVQVQDETGKVWGYTLDKFK